MSSEVLDTHRLSTIGPVTSVSFSSGGVSNETPVRVSVPCEVASEEPEATPARVIPVAE
ncbi:hypothetical protein D3C83_185630 [compost metagenome]